MKSFLRLGAGLLRALVAMAVGLFSLFALFLEVFGQPSVEDDEGVMGVSLGATSEGIEPIVGEHGAYSGERTITKP